MFRFTVMAALFSSLAHATMFMSVPLPDLVKGAPVIVRGIIGASHPDWVLDPNGGKRIFTFYAFQVEEALKGDIQGGSIQIRELGGEKEGVGMRISGTAEFSPGEDVVVMLGPKNRDGSYDVRGLSSGKFNLEKQPDGRECLSGIALGPESNDEHGHSGEKCSWDIASLRKIVREQSDTPTAKVSPSPLAPRSSLQTGQTGSNQPSSPAPGLQPSPQNEVGTSARGQLWIVVLVLGLLGLLAILLIKPRR